MWEKLKDLLYETSDLLLAFVIILIMSTTVTWKVSAALDYPNSDVKSKNIHIQESLPTASSVDEKQTPPKKDVPSESHTSTIKTVASEDIKTESADSKKQDSSSTKKALKPTSFTIEIPSGSAGSSIAKILRNKSIITDTQAFIQRIEALHLSSDLKAGSFTIPAGSSLDDVIYILTGKKN